MTIHVNIGEAKTRLSELVAAALRGEEVVLDKAGTPKVKLVPVEEAGVPDAERILGPRIDSGSSFCAGAICPIPAKP